MNPRNTILVNEQSSVNKKINNRINMAASLLTPFKKKSLIIPNKEGEGLNSYPPKQRPSYNPSNMNVISEDDENEDQLN